MRDFKRPEKIVGRASGSVRASNDPRMMPPMRPRPAREPQREPIKPPIRPQVRMHPAASVPIYASASS
jgi:hypothetical protein